MDFARHARAARVARVRWRKRYFRCTKPDSNTAQRGVAAWRAQSLARMGLRKWCGRVPTGLSDYGRELRFAALLARVNQRKRYGRAPTGFADYGRELRFAELLARVRQRKR